MYFSAAGAGSVARASTAANSDKARMVYTTSSKRDKFPVADDRTTRYRPGPLGFSVRGFIPTRRYCWSISMKLAPFD